MARPAAGPTRWKEIFAGYDIRGRYPEVLGPSVARRIGEALATALHGPFLLGRDTRRESERFARDLMLGLRAKAAHVEVLGIVPTPTVAFLAGHAGQFGLAVTPSHNAAGFVGLKGFNPRGRLFDNEWRRVAAAFERMPRGTRGHRQRSPPPKARRQRAPGIGPHAEDRYLDRITRGLTSDRSVVLDSRGGASARLAPRALRRLGARVAELTTGFSPRFFGRSPEPRSNTLGPLSERVVRSRADVGFAFDGDGDRCVVVDEQGRPVEPEVVALLLHRSLAAPAEPLVASIDASTILERRTPTIRSRVGGRFVTAAMRRHAATIGVEPSGHYYVRSYGSDSDGILVACLLAGVLSGQARPLSAIARQFGRIYRGGFTEDFPTMQEAGSAYRELVRRLGDRAKPQLEGVTLDLPRGRCLVRRSNTQPSVRFSYEAKSAPALVRLGRSVRDLAAGRVAPATQA